MKSYTIFCFLIVILTAPALKANECINHDLDQASRLINQYRYCHSTRPEASFTRNNFPGLEIAFRKMTESMIHEQKCNKKAEDAFIDSACTRTFQQLGVELLSASTIDIAILENMSQIEINKDNIEEKLLEIKQIGEVHKKYLAIKCSL